MLYTPDRGKAREDFALQPAQVENVENRFFGEVGVWIEAGQRSSNCFLESSTRKALSEHDERFIFKEVPLNAFRPNEVSSYRERSPDDLF